MFSNLKYGNCLQLCRQFPYSQFRKMQAFFRLKLKYGNCLQFVDSFRIPDRYLLVFTIVFTGIYRYLPRGIHVFEFLNLVVFMRWYLLLNSFDGIYGYLLLLGGIFSEFKVFTGIYSVFTWYLEVFTE